MPLNNENAIFEKHFNLLVQRCPGLNSLHQPFKDSINLMLESLRGEGTIFLCGNGGSSADAEHIAGELMKGFLLPRTLAESEKAKFLTSASGDRDAELLADRLQRGIRAIPLVSFTSLNTAVANDTHADLVFAQSLYALARPQDILLAISTSGNARNVELAARCAKTIGMKVVGLTGEPGGRLQNWSDVLLNAPATETCLVQELHQPIYHTMCGILEETLVE